MDSFGSHSLCDCHNVIFTPERTVDGTLIHGRNLDFRETKLSSQNALLIIRRPSGSSRRATLAVSWVGQVGLVTGANSERLSLGEVSTFASDSTGKGIPMALLLRDGLEVSGDIDGFCQYVARVERPAAYNLAICDGKSNEACAFETTSRAVFRRNPFRMAAHTHPWGGINASNSIWTSFHKCLAHFRQFGT